MTSVARTTRRMVSSELAALAEDPELFVAPPEGTQHVARDFAHLDQLADRILGFQDRYNTTATPFDWTYTRNDLNRLLARLNPDGSFRQAA
jgi:hypothetical protein